MAILRNAHFDALTSGTITTANETGINATLGTAPTFSGADAFFGQAALLTAAAVQSSVRQDLPTPLGLGYWRGYVKRVGTNTANGVFAGARDNGGTLCATLAINASGNILLRDGTAAIATSTFALGVGQSMRCEWTVNRAGTVQSVGIYHGANINGVTADETLSGACTAATSPVYNFVSGLVSAAASAQHVLDEVAIGDAPIGPFIPSPPTVTVWDGATEVAATVTVWDGATEVAASIDSVAT